MTAEKTKLTRQQMCDRLAMEFQDGWIVNLGVGMPTLCSNYVDPSREIINHSENGVVGYGPLAAEGHEDRHLVNAGGQHVTPLDGMAIVHHADSFMMIRGGMIDVTVMGAYEVAENGDFANWRIPTRKGGGIGGAMDLAACAKRVFIAMEHTTREGEPRLLKRCKLPITAPGVVKMLATDLGLFAITPDGFELVENAPGWNAEEIQELTEAKIHISPDLKEFRFRD
ncbi:MAG: 3-oxoacid CoA-transferase subunit B [Chloroflexi bacterium]|nr:3-oxoacid CoA-transferase subunit B [Chloroflexota bacterium]MYE40996.1 3-oxoacid CoA-transferase subunit B [Chloroflexota bacterium]